MTRFLTNLLLITLTFCSCYTLPYTQSKWTDINYISRWEVETSSAANAYDAVSKLRPFWLSKWRTISQGIFVRPLVYVDYSFYGEIKELHYIEAGAISSIQYLDEYDALFQFGSYRRHPAGVIWVRTGA